MSDHDDTDEEGPTRTTSPMQDYSMRQVSIGLAVLAVGLAVAFALPLLAA